MRAAGVALIVALAGGTAAAQSEPLPPAPTPAPAPTTGTAAEHYERGRRLYDVKEYAAAIEEFKAAYLIDADPIYLFNLAQAYRLAGDCAAAESYFGKYLKADPESTKREKIEKLIVECTPAEPGTSAGAGTGTTAGTTGGTELGAGSGAVEVPPPPPPVEHPGRTRRIVGLATAGAGIVIAGIGAALAIRVSGTESDLETECAAGCDWDDVRDRDSSARTQATLSTVMLVGGGLAIAGGVGLYLWGRSAGRETPRYTFVPTADGAVATATFGF